MPATPEPRIPPSLEHPSGNKEDGGELVDLTGTGSEISRVRYLISRFAPTDEPVLITGEPGVGKSRLAHLIHRLSTRADKPFVEVSLSTLPLELANAQLFGYNIGAFTGASRSTSGFVEMAANGTLFLDAIDDVPLEMQSLLLSFVGEGVYRRLGDSSLRTADVRIISSARSVGGDRIREELLTRLSGLTVVIPPLRSRPGDIPLLVDQLLQPSGTKISKSAVARLSSYPFPGNIRELQSILRRAKVLAKSNLIDERDLGLRQRNAASSRTDQQTALAELNDIRAQLDVYQRAAIIASPIWQGRNFATEQDYCFVLMPFSDVRDLPAVYEGHVKPVLKRCGLRCERADDIHDISGIMQSVWESINRARLVIADMTERNPNVFYELGIAHTLGKQVIMITQSMDYVPFDLKHLRCIVYDYKPARIDKFEAALEKTVNTVLSSSQAPALSLIKPR